MSGGGLQQKYFEISYNDLYFPCDYKENNSNVFTFDIKDDINNLYKITAIILKGNNLPCISYYHQMKWNYDFLPEMYKWKIIFWIMSVSKFLIFQKGIKLSIQF